MPQASTQTTIIEAARRVADEYWSRRAKGESVSVDDVIGVGSGDVQHTRMTAIGLIAGDLRALVDEGTGAGPWTMTGAGGADKTLVATVVAGGRVGDVAGLPQIDGYDIVGCLGRGGMGAVYEAYQQATGRRVALKLMLESAGSAEVRARFEREVEVVARLEHPGIVAIIDSGVRKGRYFYAMEYVDGLPLDKVVQPGRGDMRRAIELLAEVSEAVDYAHQRGVLHRDLKPSNVLVDQRGHAQLLDFGIAKLMDDGGAGGGATAKIGLTVAGSEQLLGTIAYMSPEQAQGLNDQVSVRTDVYALGAIGYQLLTNELPCSDQGTLKDVLTRIAEVDPPPPSTIRKSVPKDLDAVLLKALEKAPPLRYATAGVLAGELRAWLAGEPVAARRLGVPTRAWRWAKRHRTFSITASAAVFALAAVSGFLVSRVLRERDYARENFALLRGVLESADPERSMGLTVPQMLDQATQRIDKNPPRLDVTEGDVREILGTVYRKFGEYDKARVQQERVLAIRESNRTGDGPEVAEALHNLAATLWWDGKYERAGNLYLRSLEMRRRLYKGDHSAVATSLTHLAACRLRMNRLADARELYTQALEMRRRMYGSVHEEVAQALNNLARCEMEAERLPEAEKLLRQAKAMITSLKGSLDRGTAAAGQNLGECLLRRSEEAAFRGDAAAALAIAKEAREEYRDSQAIRAGIYTDGHHLVAMSLGGLARAELAVGDLEAAETAAARGLAMIRRTRRLNHADVADLLEVTGLVALARGRGAEAERDLREALQIAGSVHPPVPLRVALLQGELGGAVADPQERARLLTQSEREITRLCGEASYLTGRARQKLAASNSPATSP